jgi:sulfonate dioxygenase
MTTIAVQTSKATLSKLPLTADKEKETPAVRSAFVPLLRPKLTSPFSPQPYKYARFLPHYAAVPKQPPLTPFEHVDIGHQALNDPEPESFLANAVVSRISPKFGVEVRSGVDLTALRQRERAQLALYVARKGVVVFRDQQKFIDKDPEWQLKCVYVFLFPLPHASSLSFES